MNEYLYRIRIDTVLYVGDWGSLSYIMCRLGIKVSVTQSEMMLAKLVGFGLVSFELSHLPNLGLCNLARDSASAASITLPVFGLCSLFGCVFLIVLSFRGFLEPSNYNNDTEENTSTSLISPYNIVNPCVLDWILDVATSLEIIAASILSWGSDFRGIPLIQ